MCWGEVSCSSGGGGVSARVSLSLSLSLRLSLRSVSVSARPLRVVSASAAGLEWGSVRQTEAEYPRPTRRCWAHAAICYPVLFSAPRS